MTLRQVLYAVKLTLGRTTDEDDTLGRHCSRYSTEGKM
jgi:hypothetical protein